MKKKKLKKESRSETVSVELKKSLKKQKTYKKSETRSIDLKNDHIKAALTQYLLSLSLINDNETVTTWTPSDFKDCTQIHIRKEVVD